MIKDYFLNYNEAMTNDFVLSNGGRRDRPPEQRHPGLARSRSSNTGLKASIGERLDGVRRAIGDDEMFLATYGDGLTDAPLPEMIDMVTERDKTALLPVRATVQLLVPHRSRSNDDGLVGGFQDHDACRHLDQRRLLRPPAARSSTTSTRARTCVERALPAPDRPRGSARLSATRASGRRWTR